MTIMPEHDAQASQASVLLHMPRTYARTDALTEKNSTHVDISPNATRAGGQENFFVYSVVWHRIHAVKVGYTAHRSRWVSFVNKDDGVLHYLAGFPTERLARAHEATLLAVLDQQLRRRWDNADMAYRWLGIRNGWTEVYYVNEYLEQVLLYQFPEPVGGWVIEARKATPAWGFVAEMASRLPDVAACTCVRCGGSGWVELLDESTPRKCNHLGIA
jgi:hypothetical protein